MKIDELTTPAVLVDLTVAEANITRFQAYANAHGLNVRPHIKTHKQARLAELQLAHGAIGVTCQKVSEAEAMIDASAKVSDVLIAYNIIGREKLTRLARLNQRVRLSVVADSGAVVDGLSASFTADAPLTVLVECNTGANRCGVATPEEAATLAERIAADPRLRFGGFMTYPKPGGTAQVQAFMSAARDLAARRSVDVPVISSGGTPDLYLAHEAPVVTEHRPGTYIYNDRSLVERGHCQWDDCALSVLSTVVSVSDPDRAIIDAGSKTLTSDTLGLTGYGHVVGRDDLVISQLNEEHGIVRSSAGGATGLRVGDRVRIIPNHACVVTNMVDEIFVGDGKGDFAPWPVNARGAIT